MQVKEIMTKNVISVHPQMSINRVAAILFDNNLTGAPVLDKEGKLVGIVTEYDFISPELKIGCSSIFFNPAFIFKTLARAPPTIS